MASITKLLLDSVGRWLLEQPSLVNGRRHALYPVVVQRQHLADSLARYMGQLGLERRKPAGPSLAEFDPILRVSPTSTAPTYGDAVHVVWATVPIRLDARRTGEPYPRPAPSGRERALEQLARVGGPPTVMVDEGTAIVGLWRLARPLDPDHARVMLMQLRQYVGGDSQRVDLRDPAVALPGPLAVKVFPATRVTAGRWAPDPIDAADLERAVGVGA